jgi:DNA-binding NtrC family response regulator
MSRPLSQQSYRSGLPLVRPSGVAGEHPSTSLADESGIVGTSAAAERLRLQVRRIGPHFRTVLLRGDAGTEKELVARALHGMSQRADGPFVLGHAAALDDDAQMEGDEQDDATGSLGCLIQMAEAGTLFLDGVCEMSLARQDRLLWAMRRQEVLQSRTPGGATSLRLIATTTDDLRVLASAGRFRQELYQRLAMVEIAVPSLHARMEDIPELIHRFMDGFAAFYGRRVERVAEEALERLQRYHWPGNVAELETVLRNSVLRGDGPVLLAEDLPQLAETAEYSPAAPTLARLQDVVDQHVLRVLRSCSGNKLRAAEVLGISRSTLYRMLETCTPADGGRYTE